MNTREEYVTCTQAKTLKELGFDWTCRYYATKGYAHDEHYWKSPCLGDLRNSDLKSIWFTIPTQAVACRWLREEKSVYVSAFIGEYGFNWQLMQYEPSGRRLTPKGIGEITFENSFSTYEAALSVGIDRAIELLKGNGKDNRP